jgi:protein-tyrosine phosphatase
MRICFVCTGNICRSPTAEGILRHLLEEAGLEGIEVESAGTMAYHVGELPDPRTRAAAKRRGVALTSRAQHFQAAHFQKFDLVLALDRTHLTHLERLAAGKKTRAEIRMLAESDVPDPYYSDSAAFDEVYDICLAACTELVKELSARQG